MPVYRVSVVVPNAARLVPNNEVRIGGTRVGVVESIDAVRLPEGDGGTGSGGNDVATDQPVAADGNTDGVVARLNLKLDKSASPIPENSIFRIRYKSAFGLKYLEITRGDGAGAPEGFVFNGTNDNDDPADDDNQILSIDEVQKNEGADDGTFIAQTEFDEIGNTFDQATRNAIRENLDGYGDGFAGRGASLNQAFEALNPLLTNLQAGRRDAHRPADSARAVLPGAGSDGRDRRPGRRAERRDVRKPRDDARRDRQRSDGAAGHDRRRAADAADGDRRAARPAAVPERVRGARAAPAPGRPAAPRWRCRA